MRHESVPQLPTESKCYHCSCSVSLGESCKPRCGLWW